MKGISSLNSRPLFEAVEGGQDSETTSLNKSTTAMADKILNGNFRQPQPGVYVADNEKARKYASIIVGQITKRCGWSCYFRPTFVTIDGHKAILILNRGDDKSVGFVPTGKDTGTTFYYFSRFNDGGSNTADFMVGAGEFGVVQALSILIDYIKDPAKYKRAGLNESLSYSLNEDITRIEARRLYDTPVNSANAKRKWNAFVKSGGTKLNDIRNITMDGIQQLAMTIKAEGKDPIDVLQAIVNNDPDGVRYRRILGGGKEGDEGQKKNSDDMYVLLLRYICDTLGCEIRSEVQTSVTVGPQVTSTGGGRQIYGYDESFLIGCNIDPADFKKQVEVYEDALDLMEEILHVMIKYSRASRYDKANDPLFKRYPVALFISGLTGVGKTYTWDCMKADATLKLQKDIDYVERGTENVNPKQIYKFIYDYNGKLLIFDDSSAIFNSDFAGTFWKKVFEKPKNGIFPELGFTNSVTTDIYDPAECVYPNGGRNYKEQYLKECPPPIDRKVDTSNMTPDQLAELEAKSKKLMPKKFYCMSRFLFITNLSEETMMKPNNFGEDWTAIKGRSKFLTIAPPPLVLWRKIKKNIIEKAEAWNETITDWIPWVQKEYVDKVIGYVEDQLAQGKGKFMNFRAFSEGDLYTAIERSIRKGSDRHWMEQIDESINKSKLNAPK